MAERFGRQGHRILGSQRVVRIAAASAAFLVVLAAGVSCSGGPSQATSSSSGGAPSLAAPADAGAAAERGVGAAPAQRDQAKPGVPPADGTERAVVRTAALDIDAADVAAAVRQVRGIALVADGLITQEQSGSSGATITVRVPAAALDQVIDQIGALGTVTSRRSQATDVTDQVVDLNARVASQQASVDRIRALLARAESIADIASIESELAQREADLDSLKNRLASLNGKVALSTLIVDINGPGVAPKPADDSTGFVSGIAAGWEGFLRILVVAAAVIGFVIPFLPVIAAIAVIVWLVRRNLRRPAPTAGGQPDPVPAVTGGTGDPVAAGVGSGPGSQGGPSSEGDAPTSGRPT